MGPLALGHMWSHMLYGILMVQMYIYYVHFPKDQIGLKVFVWTVFVLETIFTIFTTIAAWDQFGLNWGEIQSHLIIDWSWEPLPALNGFLAMMVQSFYVWRIYNLTRNIWVSLFIESVSLTQCTLAFYYGIRVSVESRGIDELFALTDVISAWLILSAACDALITITIVFVLQRANRRTKFKQTTSAITRLIHFSVETGLITSVMAVIELILWITSRQWKIHFIGFLVLGKLYSNALVATLNSRASVFGDLQSYKGWASIMSQIQSTFWDDTRSLVVISESTHRMHPSEIGVRRNEMVVNLKNEYGA